MNRLILQVPAAGHKDGAEHFKREFFQFQEPTINGSALLDQMAYDPWLVQTTNNRSPGTVSSDWVVADTFFAVRQRDSEIVGMIDIRHSLNNDFLAQFGGHIGYSVRPSQRRQGYATEMLGLGLQYAKALGLTRVMLGCYADNLPSIRTIEACGGVLAETKPYVDGTPMRVYWIALS